MSRPERILVIGACIFASAFLEGVTTNAATYYVATTGNDANSCAQAISQKTPRLTIPAGVACLAGGDTLIVKAGTYINQEITNPPAGTASAYTVIKGDPSGARPVINPNRLATQRGFYCSRGETCKYIEMRYFEVTNAYNGYKLHGDDTVGYAHHMRIIDNVFHDNGSTDILIATSFMGFLGGDHLIQGNEFYHTGIHNPGYKPGHNTIYNPGNRTIIEHNTFHHLQHGVGIWTSKKLINNVIVRNNVFYDIGRTLTDTWQQGANGYTGIHVSSGGGGHQIYNNIIYRSCDTSSCDGIVIKPYFSGDQTTPIKVYNNTIYDLKHAKASAIRVVPTTGGPHLIKNNIAYLAGAGIVGGTQLNNMTDDPSFRDPARGKFALQSRSAAIDAGEVLDIDITDFTGVRRPQGAGYDIGAYEMGDGDDPLPPRNLSFQ